MNSPGQRAKKKSKKKQVGAQIIRIRRGNLIYDYCRLTGSTLRTVHDDATHEGMNHCPMEAERKRYKDIIIRICPSYLIYYYWILTKLPTHESNAYGGSKVCRNKQQDYSVPKVFVFAPAAYIIYRDWRLTELPTNRQLMEAERKEDNDTIQTAKYVVCVFNLLLETGGARYGSSTNGGKEEGEYRHDSRSKVHSLRL